VFNGEDIAGLPPDTISAQAIRALRTDHDLCRAPRSWKNVRIAASRGVTLDAACGTIGRNRDVIDRARPPGRRGLSAKKDELASNPSHGGAQTESASRSLPSRSCICLDERRPA